MGLSFFFGSAYRREFRGLSWLSSLSWLSLSLLLFLTWLVQGSDGAPHLQQQQQQQHHHQQDSSSSTPLVWSYDTGEVVSSSSQHARERASFQEQRFRHKVQRTLSELRRMLNATKAVQLAIDQDHTYDDKYALVEFVTVETWNTLSETLFPRMLNQTLPQLLLLLQQQQQVGQQLQNDTTTTTTTIASRIPPGVVLQFDGSTTCMLEGERVVEVKSPVVVVEQQQQQRSSWTGSSSSSSTKKTTTKTTIHHVREYEWNVTEFYQFRLCWKQPTKNTTTSPLVVSCRQLLHRSTSTRITTSTPDAPTNTNTNIQDYKPQAAQCPRTVHAQLDLEWWLRHIIIPVDNNHQDNPNLDLWLFEFAIDRRDAACHTPRRNFQVQTVLEWHQKLLEWLQTIQRHLHSLFISPSYHGPLLEQLPDYSCGTTTSTLSFDDNNNNNGVLQDLCWNPAFPLLESDINTNTSSSARLLSADTVALLRAQQDEILQRRLTEAAAIFFSQETISVVEAHASILVTHAVDRIRFHRHAVELVETMVHNQLIKAIGHELQAADFRQFMDLYAPLILAIPPQPLAIAVRSYGYNNNNAKTTKTATTTTTTSSSTPVGSLSLVETNDPATASYRANQNKNPAGQSDQPVPVLIRHMGSSSNHNNNQTTTPLDPVRVPLDASTTIALAGDRFVAAWLRYDFGTTTTTTNSADSSTFQLVARARQFSSFILVVGTLDGPSSFQPQHALILKNKDRVVIPLLVNTLPSVREFRNAVASLSPAQAEFARAFRALQLQSSVTAVALIPLKPQLEKLLQLTPGSLAKEIQLTEDLVDLFVEHQIPADILSYDEGDVLENNNNNAGLRTTTTASDSYERVQIVRGHVDAVKKIIRDLQQEALEQEKQSAKARRFMQQDGSRPTGAPVVNPSSEPSSSNNVRLVRSTMMYSRMAAPAEVEMDDSIAFTAAATPTTTTESTTTTTSETSSSQRDYPSRDPSSDDTTTSSRSLVADVTQLPVVLDAKIAEHDGENYLRSVTMRVADSGWTLTQKPNLLVDEVQSTLLSTGIAAARAQAFDLLDALTKSGSLAIETCDVYALFGVSHSFVHSVMDTLVQDNINPIEKAEKSLLLLASTLFEVEPHQLLARAADRERLATLFPNLVAGPTATPPPPEVAS